MSKAMMICLGSCATVICILSLSSYILEILFWIGVGWIAYLASGFPRIHLDGTSVFVTVTSGALVSLGLHWFLCWYYRHFDKPNSEREIAEKPLWKWRWTLSILGAVLLVFVSSISIIGVAHQISWLTNSPEPIASTSYAGSTFSQVENSFSYQVLGNGIIYYSLNHEDHLPTGGFFDDSGRGLQGWQTALLPFIEQQDLYKKIDQRKPWNESENSPCFKQLVRSYVGDSIEQRHDEKGFALSHVSSNVRVIGGDKALKLQDMTDGASNTLMIGQVNSNFKPWGHPCNWRDPALGINRSPDGFGNHPGRNDVMFIMADGSLRVISKNIAPEVLRTMSTPNGGD